MRLWAVGLAVGFITGLGHADIRQLPAAPRLGAISGSVRDASDGSRVGGAIVQLGQPGTPSRRVVTDDLGRFVFTDLAPGLYNVTASRLGYSDGHFGLSASAAPLGSAIALGPGEWMQDANVALRRLGSISGAVYDRAGKPLVGAFVRVLRRFELNGHMEFAVGPVATTDDLGRYRIGALTPGEYLVVLPSVQRTMPASASTADVEGVQPEVLRAIDSQARQLGAEPARRTQGALREGDVELMVGPYPVAPPAENGAVQAYPVTFFPSTSDISSAAPIEIQAGTDRQGIDLIVQPAAGYRISGVVRTDGTDLRGMVLRLMLAGFEHVGTGSEAATTSVAPDGAFVFLDVPSGDYVLTAPGATSEFALRQPLSLARVPGLPGTPGVSRFGSGATGGLVLVAPDIVYNALTPKTLEDRHAGFGRLPVNVTSKDVTGLVLQLNPSGAVRGRVIVDGSADPTVGTLELAPAGPDVREPVHTVMVDLKSARMASFDMTAVMPGEYALRVIGLPLTIESIVQDGQDASRRPVVISSGVDADVTVTLTPKSIQLSGRVVDSRSQIVSQALVIAFPTDRTLWTRVGLVPTWIRVAAASNRGGFVVTGLRAGEYYVAAIADTGAGIWSNSFLSSLATRAARTTLVWGQSAIVDAPLLQPAK